MTDASYREEREHLVNVRESRSWAEEYSFRKDKATGDYILEGYAATYEPYDCHGGPQAGGWVEQLDQRAFDDTLSAQPDVQLLINHTGEPLARTKSGTLKLSRDKHGLRVWARLDPSDPDVQRLAPKMRRKDMDEMSFAFRVNEQDWDTSYTHRTIRALSLQKGDVSVVNYGMNPGTQAAIVDAVQALSHMSTKELIEMRSAGMVDVDAVRRAAQVLSTIAAPVVTPVGSIGPVPLHRDGSKEPYGDVTYADPGYKSDGKKRYPINNAEKVRAAWSYVNMPKNQKGYTSSQVSAIKGRIKTAAKKFGVEISEGKSAVGTVGLSHIENEGRGLIAVMTDGSRVPLPAQRALPAARSSLTGNGENGDWHPNGSPIDPHNEPYKEGDYGVIGVGPIPDNIVGGAFTGHDGAAFSPPGPSPDPHDAALDAEMLAMDDPHDCPTEAADIGSGSHLTPAHAELGTPLSGGDPHNTPYDLGGQVGGVPGDRPNYGKGPQGKVADNIVVGGTGTGPLGASHEMGPGPVGTAPVVTEGTPYDWTKGAISTPDDPAEELDHPVSARGKEGRLDGNWAPSNIEGGGGGGDAGDSDDADDPNDEVIKLDIGMAEALDRTIVHCYQLSQDIEVRRKLVVARRQLTTLRGVNRPSPQAESDISQKLAQMRSEVGVPTTSTVSGGLHYLRSVASAPVGFRGGLGADPSCHVTTPGERLLREAREKEKIAVEAAAESDKAEARLKAARREAQLNDVIRRRNKDR